MGIMLRYQRAQLNRTIGLLSMDKTYIFTRHFNVKHYLQPTFN